MKITATIQIIDNQVFLSINTRAFHGNITAASAVYVQSATRSKVAGVMSGWLIPGFGEVEHGQEIDLDWLCEAPKRDHARFNSPNTFQGERNVGKELRSHVPSGTRYSDWP